MVDPDAVHTFDFDVKLAKHIEILHVQCEYKYSGSKTEYNITLEIYTNKIVMKCDTTENASKIPKENESKILKEGGKSVM